MAVVFGSNKLIEAGDMASSFQSEGINLHNKHGFSIHSVFTGSPNGTTYLAISIDGSTWTVLSNSSQAVSAAGDVFYSVERANYSWVRFHYTASSGSGSMNVFFNTKGEV